ncbi:hypothetical protein INP83_17440 [Mucilaginibacter sp. 21P]|uniref:hypothetical protein n=1 Tax=Mucilaginibacter sp. 21P TaxID=2778902 RepID=UPI001C59EBB1|nr:hypothetical protein [Mucilaginibacter sp. 21P]QXV64849.1 hypothetical protein INP83_17440 [Mucilaginibacter sp. 21P]
MNLNISQGGSISLPGDQYSFIESLQKWSWWVLVLTSVLQVFVFTTLPNAVAVVCVLATWYYTKTVFLKIGMIKDYPLSTFLILGFTLTQFYFPLLFTLAEWKPVVFNLVLPYQVFLHSTLTFAVLVIAHYLYRQLPYTLHKRERSLLAKAGLYTPPTHIQLWIMGLLGIGATFYVYLYSPNIGWEVTGSASDKAIQSLMPFSYAPFFIPFTGLYGSKQPLPKMLIAYLVGFTILLFLVSIGRNSRGGFMIGFTSVGFSYFMGLLLGVYKAKFLTVKNAVIALGAYLLFTGPIADIGTAMVLVRGQRMDIPYDRLISLTFEAYQDKRTIEQYRQSDITGKPDWDENYLNNIFLARFSNIKFNDASLIEAKRIGRQDPLMRKFNIDYVLSILPQPLLDVLKINVDKKMLRGVSIGDYLYYRAGGPKASLGGYRTGSMAGIGMATFGWWYLAILGIGIMPVFYLFDLLFTKQIIPGSRLGSSTTKLSFSLCGMLLLDSIFRFLPAESATATATFLIRDFLQLVVLYLVVYHLTKVFNILSPKPKALTRRQLDMIDNNSKTHPPISLNF